MFDFSVRCLRIKLAAVALGQNIVITLYCVSVIAGYLQEAVEGSDWAAAFDGGTLLPETKDEEELPHLVNWIVSVPGVPRHQPGGYHQTQFMWTWMCKKAEQHGVRAKREAGSSCCESPFKSSFFPDITS